MTRWRTEIAVLLLLAAVALSALTTNLGNALAQDGRRVNVTPTQLTFHAVANGPTPPQQFISVTASSATPFTAIVVQSGTINWLSISPSGRLTTNQRIAVTANPAHLSPGTYRSTVAIRTGEETIIPVSVTFVVGTGVNFQVSPTSLTFSANVGGSAPPSQSVSVTANTPTPFTATASGSTNWLSINPSGNLVTPRTISVSVNPAGLAAGTYNGAITITGGGVTITVVVSFVLNSTGGAGLTVTPAQLSFSATAGGSAPAAQSISVTASSATPFTASAAAQTGTWLTISPSGSLTTNQTINVNANPTGLAAATYSGTVTITGGGATHTVTVSFVISSVTPPPTGSFTLIGWNDLGMHCDDGQDYSVFGLLPPYNTLHAHLIDKSGTLVVNPAGLTITYQGTHDPLTNTINTISSPKTNWWTYAAGLVAPLGFPPPALDAGLAPAGTAGAAMPGLSNTPQAMTFSTSDNTWTCTGLPEIPYGDAAAPPFPSNSYPMMQLTATNSSGTVLATTNIVVPVSDDIGCKTCHGSTSGNTAAMPAGGWSNLSDPNKDYKHNILKKHDDRFASSSLYQTAAAAVGYSTTGLEPTTATKPVLCINCHAEVFLGLPGQPGIENEAHAMHSLHGPQIDPATGQSLDAGTTRAACYRCHPGSTSQCLRGVMGNLTDASGNHLIECQSCHGNLTALAASTRKPWFDEPNCQACHTGTAVTNNGQIVYNTVFTSGTTMRVAVDQTFATNPNTPATGESLFRFSSGHGGLQCEACHGSTHAEYPTSNVNDNVQSTNLQGHTGVLVECATCHATVPSTVTGGPHGMHPVGASWVSSHQGAAEAGTTACQICHGTDYRGTILSKTLADRTLAGRSFPAGTVIGCYSCHNGPGGG